MATPYWKDDMDPINERLSGFELDGPVAPLSDFELGVTAAQMYRNRHGVGAVTPESIQADFGGLDGWIDDGHLPAGTDRAEFTRGVGAVFDWRGRQA